MPVAIFIFSMSLLHLVVYVESALIVVLLCFTGWMLLFNMHYVDKCEQARRERDEARRTLQTLRRMSEIHADTVARLRGYRR
jgi:hypothetical protein